MENPTFNIIITYSPLDISGMTTSYAGGITYSIPTYSTDYYTAFMPEVGISATGSSYTESLSNLLLIATASTTIATSTPLNQIHY